MKTYLKHFRRVIRKRFPDHAAQLLTALESQVKPILEDTRFAARSGNPMDKRLDFTAWFLALIKVMDGEGRSFEEIRAVSLDVITEFVRPKNELQAWLRRQSAQLVGTRPVILLLRWMEKKLRKRAHPDGFVARVITDKEATYGLGYGVDILECGICKLFQKHGYSKYASILCEVDKLTSSLAGLELLRTGTIANGAERCDFRWRRTQEAAGI